MSALCGCAAGHESWCSLGRPTLDVAWADTRAVLGPSQRLVLFSDATGVSYIQVLEPIADDEDMRPVVTVPAYPEQPELRDSSWVDALRGVRERLAELAAAEGRRAADLHGEPSDRPGPSQRAGSGGVRSDALARRRGSRDRRSRMRIVWGDEVPGARELPAGHRLCFYGLTFGWLGIGVIRSVKRPSKARRGDE